MMANIPMNFSVDSAIDSNLNRFAETSAIYLDTLIGSNVFLTQNFLADAETTPSLPPATATVTTPKPEREAVQILVIGSSQSIEIIIRTLHQLRFAEVREWSPLLPAPTPGKLMRTLTRNLAIAN